MKVAQSRQHAIVHRRHERRRLECAPGDPLVGTYGAGPRFPLKPYFAMYSHTELISHTVCRAGVRFGPKADLGEPLEPPKHNCFAGLRGQGYVLRRSAIQLTKRSSAR